ncbi:MAG: hypothetical protein ACR2MP_14955 [Streptosporangiaceae bacterium]
MTAVPGARRDPSRQAGAAAGLVGTGLVGTGLMYALLAAALVPLVVVTRQNPLTSISQMLAITLPFAVVGAVVASRQPGNPLGWLMLAVGGLFLLITDAGLYSVPPTASGTTCPPGRLTCCWSRCGSPAWR